MREIKFRAWQKENKILMDVLSMSLFGSAETSFILGIEKDKDKDKNKITYYLLDDVILMQFTGQVDVNKNEIFEGDILEDEEENRILVEWDIKYNPEPNEYTIGFILPSIWFSNMKIIGNIYETPEKLQACKTVNQPGT